MFYPRTQLGKWSNLTIIFFGWVENIQLDHYNIIWHLGFAPQRHGCLRKAGALHVQRCWRFCTTGTSVPVVQNLQDWMISTAWKTPFRAGKMPCPRIGPDGCCWMGEGKNCKLVQVLLQGRVMSGEVHLQHFSAPSCKYSEVLVQVCRFTKFRMIGWCFRCFGRVPSLSVRHFLDQWKDWWKIHSRDHVK